MTPSAPEVGPRHGVPLNRTCAWGPKGGRRGIAADSASLAAVACDRRGGLGGYWRPYRAAARCRAPFLWAGGAWASGVSAWKREAAAAASGRPRHTYLVTTPTSYAPRLATGHPLCSGPASVGPRFAFCWSSTRRNSVWRNEQGADELAHHHPSEEQRRPEQLEEETARLTWAVLDGVADGASVGRLHALMGNEPRARSACLDVISLDGDLWRLLGVGAPDGGPSPGPSSEPPGRLWQTVPNG